MHMITVTLTLVAVGVVLLSCPWTDMVLGLSIIGSLYQWPFLQEASTRLLTVTFIATFVGMLIILAMNPDIITSLQYQLHCWRQFLQYQFRCWCQFLQYLFKRMA